MRNIDSWCPSKFVVKDGKLIASRDDREVSIGSRLVADIVASYFDQHMKNHVYGDLLDLGCGKAPLYTCYKDYVTSITCADWGNSLHDNIYLDLICDLNKPIPINDNSFDTIILSDVLEHIYDPQSLWNEISRVLRPNGKLILSVPYYYWLHEQPHDYYRYTEFALKRFALHSGLNIRLLESVGGIPEIISDLLSKYFMTLRHQGWRLSSYTHRLTQWILQTETFSTISQNTRQDFPLGYFLVAQKLKKDEICYDEKVK